MNLLKYFLPVLGIGLGVLIPTNTAQAVTQGDSTLVQQKNRVRFFPPSAPHLNELSIWAGIGFDSYRLWGKTPDARLSSLGLSYKRKFLAIHNADLEYVLHVSAYSSYSYPEYKPGHPRNTLYGFGFSPLGLQANFFSNKTVQPFLNSSGGIMFLNGPFPDRRGEKLNFTFTVGTGIEIMLSESVSLSAGVKYYHLSNGEMGQINPGLDSNFIYTTITIF